MDPAALQELIIPGAIILGVALVLVSLTLFFGREDPLQRRIEQIASYEDRPVRDGEVKLKYKTRAKGIAAWLPNIEKLQLRLEGSGMKITPTRLVVVMVLIGVLATAVLVVLARLPSFVALAVGAAAGFSLPMMFLAWRVSRRKAQFLKNLPDVIDIIVRTVRSGLPIADAVHAVANDLTGPAAEEFRKVSDNMRIGFQLEAALQRTADRLGPSDFNFLIIVLSIQRETGGNLTEALANLSTLLRRRMQMKLKIRALSSEARASAIIIGSLPIAVIIILTFISPEFVRVLIDDERGQTLLAIAIAMMLGGFGVMAKMVRFEI